MYCKYWAGGTHEGAHRETDGAPARAVCLKCIVNNAPGAHMKEPTGRENVSVNPPEWWGAALTSRTTRSAHHPPAQLKATSAAGASDRRLAVVFHTAPEAPMAPA